ncbi:putative Max-like protein X [Hypsibius exemplaris]|uniref:Max-like protein X n=1 Tax=Hypsibius exemplaris TaxID=2072580 RepID=A0A1W0X2E3_HYPEX|nr:putative Max-like protein X [Hypsibius exemplaris]
MNRRDLKKTAEHSSLSSELTQALSHNSNNNSGVFSPAGGSGQEGRNSDFYSHNESPQQGPGTSSGNGTPLSMSRRNSLNNSEPISADESDDDGQYEGKPGLSFRERRREAHTQAEQKRRDAIKKGYKELEEELPSVQENQIGSQKPSKALVMQKSIDYVHYLEEQKRKSAEELDGLQKDYMGLQIMKQTYEKMAAAARNQPDQGVTPVSDDVKFRVFQLMMENLFESFDARVSADNFAELSGSAFNWLEEACTPQNFRSITSSILRDVKTSSKNQAASGSKL